MENKGLDTTFMHYGIRKEDMEIIESLCGTHEVSFDWLKENVLKEYHNLKVKNEEMEFKNIEKIIKKAINNI